MPPKKQKQQQTKAEAKQQPASTTVDKDNLNNLLPDDLYCCNRRIMRPTELNDLEPMPDYQPGEFKCFRGSLLPDGQRCTEPVKAGDFILQEDFLGDRADDCLRVYSHLRTCIDATTAAAILPKADTALLHVIDFEAYKGWLKLQRTDASFFLAKDAQLRRQLLERDSPADWLETIIAERKRRDLFYLKGGYKLIQAFDELALKRARGETARGVTVPPGGGEYVVDEHMQVLERSRVTAAQRKKLSEAHERNRASKAAKVERHAEKVQESKLYAKGYKAGKAAAAAAAAAADDPASKAHSTPASPTTTTSAVTSREPSPSSSSSSRAPSDTSAMDVDASPALLPRPAPPHTESSLPPLRLDESGIFKKPRPPRTSAAASAAPATSPDLVLLARARAPTMGKDEGKQDKGKRKAGTPAIDTFKPPALQSTKAASPPSVMVSPREFPETSFPFDLDYDGPPPSALSPSASTSPSLFASSSSSAFAPASTLAPPPSLFSSSFSSSFPLALDIPSLSAPLHPPTISRPSTVPRPPTLAASAASGPVQQQPPAPWTEAFAAELVVMDAVEQSNPLLTISTPSAAAESAALSPTPSSLAAETGAQDTLATWMQQIRASETRHELQPRWSSTRPRPETPETPAPDSSSHKRQRL